MKHYEDFLQRMPREEAAEIEQTVSLAPRALRRARLEFPAGQLHRQKQLRGYQRLKRAG